MFAVRMANREQFSELGVLQNKGVTQKDPTCLEMEGWGSCDAFGIVFFPSLK